MKLVKGFSIVELMVSITLGLILMGGVIQILVSSNASYNELVQQGRMQEAGKLALDYIVRDVRNVGYWGCSGTDIPITNTVQGASAGTSGFDLSKAIVGFEKGDTTNTPAAYATEITKTDILELKLINIDGGLRVKSHNAQAAQIDLNVTNPMKQGTIWAIVDADCSSVGVFAQTSVANTNGNNSNAQSNVVHSEGVGAGIPVKNCTKFLKGNFDCSTLSGQAIEEGYSPGSFVYSMDEITYIVKPSSKNASVNSLYRISSRTISGDVEELIDGINQLKFTYGLDTTGDRMVDRYATAKSMYDNGFSFEDVLTVTIEVTAESLEDLGIADQTFTTTVKIRNRGL